MKKSEVPIFLIVDNHTWVVRLTKWRLEQIVGTKVNVLTGSSGEDAIKLFDEVVQSGNHSSLQLVLLGCHMPVYTGMQAVQIMRTMERNCQIMRPVEIIGTTADLNDEVYREFVQAGANIVLTKPVPEGELEDVFVGILARNASRHT